MSHTPLFKIDNVLTYKEKIQFYANHTLYNTCKMAKDGMFVSFSFYSFTQFQLQLTLDVPNISS